MEADQLRGRLGQDHMKRVGIGYPPLQIVDATLVRHAVLVRHKRPVARPDELLRSGCVEQGIDVALTIDAALPVGRGEFYEGLADAHAFEHALESWAGYAARGIRAAEMIDDDARTAFANARQDVGEQRTFEVDLDVPAQFAHG